ncbi:MAG: ABC transporter substrate-binding protein [Thermomicrobiales bacterium]
MLTRSDRTRQLADLAFHVHEGHLSRRGFIVRALALGVSLSAGEMIFRTYRAAAQDAPENPITVTVGGTPVAAMEPDLTNATPGGTFRFGRGEDSTNLDPVTNDGNVNIWLFMNIYDQLIRVGPDGISLVPGLAERWEVSDDGLTYTFHLRPNIQFSDGSPMTAKDVKWSWERAANDPGQHWTFTLTALKRNADGQVEGISTPDDTTVVVELAQPWSPFLSDVAMFNMSVISQAFAEGKEDRLTQEAMGTGPFSLAEWKKGEYVRLVKNPNYWEEGLPLLDEVLVSLVPDDNARILQLQGGELDGMYNVPSSRVPELQLDPNLKVYQFPSTHTQYITLNTRNAPLDDVHARRALQYATDRQTLIDVVLFGVGVPATTFMPKGALYWNDTLEGFPYDLAKAQEELAQSATPNGFAIELKTLAGNADDETLATALKDMWSQIGVELTISPFESGVLFDDYNNNNFQAMSNYWTNDIIDPDELVAYAVLPESTEAFRTGWNNKEAQDLARQGAAESDPAKRKEIYFRIQEIYNEDSPMLMLYHKPYVDVTTTKVHNHNHPPTGQWDWRTTWIEQ